MARPRTYPSPDSLRYLSVNEIAAEIDRTPAQTEKLLKKVAYLGLKPVRTKTRGTAYPAAAVEVLKGVLGLGHRTIPTPDGDWLSTYEGDRA